MLCNERAYDNKLSLLCTLSMIIKSKRPSHELIVYSDKVRQYYSNEYYHQAA